MGARSGFGVEGLALWLDWRFIDFRTLKIDFWRHGVSCGDMGCCMASGVGVNIFVCVVWCVVVCGWGVVSEKCV